MNIILCGLPCSGKTTLGKEWAKESGWGFIDTDTALEELDFQRTGNRLSCYDIHQKRGEEAFRSLEGEVLAECLSLQEHVIALGGGTLVDLENQSMVRNLGTVCYLKVDLITIERRMTLRGIPSPLDPHQLTSSLQALAKKRNPIYEAMSHFSYSP